MDQKQAAAAMVTSWRDTRGGTHLLRVRFDDSLCEFTVTTCSDGSSTVWALSTAEAKQLLRVLMRHLFADDSASA